MIDIQDTSTAYESSTPKDIDNSELEPIKSLPEELEDSTLTSADSILKASNADELQQCIDMFNVNIAKKNALRVMKLDQLQDMVENEVIKRFTNRSDDMSNVEVIQYYKAVQDSVKNAQNTLNNKDNTTFIQINQNTENNVNITTGTDRESNERVMNAVKSILNQIRNNPPQEVTKEDEIIEAEVVENSESTEASVEDTKEGTN